MASSPKILIIGGGLGGLVLGQGLKRHGLPFQIFERDSDVSFRAQGYRIRISPEGGAALQSLIPEHLWQAFEASCGELIHGGHRLDAATGKAEKMGPMLPAGFHRGPGTVAGSKAWNADRGVLRQLLLSGLEQDVVFGKHFLHYETGSDDRVTAHFADGLSATGDFLVGADGVWSAVRQQQMPDFDLLDTGSRAVFGKTPLQDGVAGTIPAEIGQGICLTGHGPGTPLQLLSDTMRFKHDAARQVEADLKIQVPLDYVYWVLLFSLQIVEERGGDKVLRHMSGSQSVKLSQDLTRTWHESVRAILSQQDPDSASTLTVLTTTADAVKRAFVERSKADRQDPRVILIGDSKHPMPPVGGVGANSAFQDAAELYEVFRQHAGNTTAWYQDGLAAFEEGVHKRAKAAVEMSVGGAGRMFGMQPVAEMKPAKHFA